MIKNLITRKTPPEKRKLKTEGVYEMHFSEAAVMLAFAFYLFKQDDSLTMVEIHPDISQETQ